MGQKKKGEYLFIPNTYIYIYIYVFISPLVFCIFKKLFGFFFFFTIILGKLHHNTLDQHSDFFQSLSLFF
jgi:hypothetical protein